MTMHLGIDIGVQAAIAIVDPSGALVEIHDMPVLKDGPAGRRAINAPLLAAVISSRGMRIMPSSKALAQGPGKALWGRSLSAGPKRCHRGRSCRRWPSPHVLTPPCWQRAVGLTLASKDASRAEAIRRARLRRFDTVLKNRLR
jgi:crossover junction endodeoxyribonuclease RuvC